MSIFQRSTSRRNSPAASTNKKLRLESLERKNLLAGDVTASIVGGDLFLSGDIDDNFLQIVRDESQVSPGTGEVTVRGLFGTTINGAAAVDFNGANAITGDVLIDFGTNGQDSATIGVSPFVDPAVLALPGSVIITGGSIGFESISFDNTSVAGDVILDDLAGGDSANLSFQDSVVQGDIASNTTSEFSDVVLSRTDVGGDVSLASTTGSNSVLQTSTSTVGGNLSLTSDNDESAASVSGTQVEGSILIHTGDGDDSFTFGEDLLGDGVTVGNDVVISSGAGDDTFDLSAVDAADDIRIDAGAGEDELSLVSSAAGDDLRIKAGADGIAAFVSAITIGDDLEFKGGDGDDDFGLFGDEGDNFIGDDVYITGRDGNDIATIEAATVGDKVRIALGAGDDESFVVESTIGHSVLISLGSGFNQSEIEDTDAGHYLTILARGTNELSLSGVTVSNAITLLTGSGSDVIELEGVTAHSTWIATYAGEDEVAITESEFDLLYVFLGSGDDTLTLDAVTVDWFAVLSGGCGEDTLIDVDDASDINFEIDFAFENFGV